MIKPGRRYRNWLISALVLVGCFSLTFLARRSLWHLLWIIPICYLGSVILRVYRLTHARVSVRLSRQTPADAGLPYEQARFPSRDGLGLFGWYVPGSNRAAVVLVHGAGSQGIALVNHSVALARHGYGVLMLDLRAHGRSEGDTCTGGWLEIEDLLGAVDYVQGREDVAAAGKVGVLGISLGGQIALRAAARSGVIGGVVAEGPSMTILADQGGRPTTLRRWITYPLNWLFYALQSFMNGAKPTSGVLDTIADIAPRPLLLISTGTGQERHFVRLLYRAAQEPKEVWGLPEAHHGAGYVVYPTLYAQKITEFFDAALNPRPADEGEQAGPILGEHRWSAGR